MAVKPILIATCALLAVMAPRLGAASNGVTQFEIPYTETDYVACLNEEVKFDVTVKVHLQYFQAPSGAVHYLENWFIEGTATGLSSGYSWYGTASSPFVSNSRDAAASQGWILAAMYTPLNGGVKFRKSQRLRHVSDANGVSRVERVEPYDFRCFGH